MNKDEGLLLDTHVWIWFEKAEPLVSPASRRRIEDAFRRDRLFIASISLLEVANQFRRKRIALPVTLNQFFHDTLSKPGLRVKDLTPEIALETSALPPTFHGDPADRLIAATARVEDLTLCTHDKTLLLFGKQGLFRTLPI